MSDKLYSFKEESFYVKGGYKKVSDMSNEELIELATMLKVENNFLSGERDYLRRLCIAQAAQTTVDVNKVTDGRNW